MTLQIIGMCDVSLFMEKASLGLLALWLVFIKKNNQIKFFLKKLKSVQSDRF